MTGYLYTFGETMALYRTTESGGLETVTDAKLGIGGADSNVAIGARRLGVDAKWTGRVGDDSLGLRIVRELRAEGVDVHAIVDREAPTGLMLKEKRTADSTRVYFYRRDSAGSRLTEDDLDEDLIRGAAVLHVTGITASLSPTAERAVFAAIETARAAGVTVSCDVNHRASLWRTGDPGGLYRRIATMTDVLFAGDDEARLIAPGADSPVSDLAERLSELGPSEVIVKLGAEGSTGVIGGEPFSRPAHRIRVVDSVGAGDAFVAGYLAARIAGEGIAQRLGLATDAGAFACLGPGDWESLPRREDLRLLSASEPVVR
ncbi:sugar kinase [Herbiconiux sp. CPCC 205763]|uniref:Sugar kinase n=1 Tax=Herbiconiux aconitum TaxID=2970913 RepID=A0ABT2GQW8_9MICO|nr:sugar kinase [Herbiconiux aconitum]MCS5717690.1 sugar kinase [Herbiconiux aconitum]